MRPSGRGSPPGTAAGRRACKKSGGGVGERAPARSPLPSPPPFLSPGTRGSSTPGTGCLPRRRAGTSPRAGPEEKGTKGQAAARATFRLHLPLPSAHRDAAHAAHDHVDGHGTHLLRAVRLFDRFEAGLRREGAIGVRAGARAARARAAPPLPLSTHTCWAGTFEAMTLTMSVSPAALASARTAAPAPASASASLPRRLRLIASRRPVDDAAAASMVRGRSTGRVECQRAGTRAPHTAPRPALLP